MANKMTGDRHPKKVHQQNRGEGGRHSDAAVRKNAVEGNGAAIKGAEKIWDNLKEVGEDVKHRVVEDIDEWRDTATEYVEEGRDRIEQLGTRVGRKIRNQPFTSICLAVGVGILFGAMWRRR